MRHVIRRYGNQLLVEIRPLLDGEYAYKLYATPLKSNNSGRSHLYNVCNYLIDYRAPSSGVDGDRCRFLVSMPYTRWQTVGPLNHESMWREGPVGGAYGVRVTDNPGCELNFRNVRFNSLKPSPDTTMLMVGSGGGTEPIDIALKVTSKIVTVKMTLPSTGEYSACVFYRDIDSPRLRHLSSALIFYDSQVDEAGAKQLLNADRFCTPEATEQHCLAATSAGVSATDHGDRLYRSSHGLLNNSAAAASDVRTVNDSSCSRLFRHSSDVSYNITDGIGGSEDNSEEKITICEIEDISTAQSTIDESLSENQESMKTRLHTGYLGEKTSCNTPKSSHESHEFASASFAVEYITVTDEHFEFVIPSDVVRPCRNQISPREYCETKMNDFRVDEGKSVEICEVLKKMSSISRLDIELGYVEGLEGRENRGFERSGEGEVEEAEGVAEKVGDIGGDTGIRDAMLFEKEEVVRKEESKLENDRRDEGTGSRGVESNFEGKSADSFMYIDMKHSKSQLISVKSNQSKPRSENIHNTSHENKRSRSMDEGDVKVSSGRLHTLTRGVRDIHQPPDIEDQSTRMSTSPFSASTASNAYNYILAESTESYDAGVTCEFTPGSMPALSAKTTSVSVGLPRVGAYVVDVFTSRDRVLLTHVRRIVVNRAAKPDGAKGKYNHLLAKYIQDFC